jgi:hypothetical protein
MISSFIENPVSSIEYLAAEALNIDIYSNTPSEGDNL